MWVHFNRDKDVLSNGDVLQARRGRNVLGTIRISDNGHCRNVMYYDPKGKLIYSSGNVGSYSSSRVQLSNGVRQFHGTSLYLWDKEPPNVVEGGRWALVHKPFVTLRTGQKFNMRPMSTAHDAVRYDLEVIFETKFDKPYFDIEITNVNTKGSWRTGVEKLTDLKFLDKHSAYMFIKEEPVGFKQLVAAENKIKPQAVTIATLEAEVANLRRRQLAFETSDLRLKSAVADHLRVIKEQGDEITRLKDTSDPTGQYIIWCPTSNLPPRKINTGRSQAKAIAASMSERHGTTFYWCKLMGKVEQKVIKTTETKITEL